MTLAEFSALIAAIGGEVYSHVTDAGMYVNVTGLYVPGHGGVVRFTAPWGEEAETYARYYNVIASAYEDQVENLDTIEDCE